MNAEESITLPVVLLVKLPVSMFVTVEPNGLVIAAVVITVNVSAPAPPSSASPADQEAATRALNVSVPDAPVKAAPRSPLVVSGQICKNAR